LNPRHRYLLRALLWPGALLVVAAIAYVGVEVYELDSSIEMRWLIVISLLAVFLMLLALLRMESILEERAKVHGRERHLVEQQRAFDRLHAGVSLPKQTALPIRRLSPAGNAAIRNSWHIPHAMPGPRKH
jgi:hypothetical protein